MAFVGIKHLTPTFRQGALLARVSRMWDFRGGKDAQDIQHVDLVLLDPEGTAIYAEIGAANVETKKPLLVEGDIHVFRRFRVTESKPTYRPVESRYMIDITHLTLIDKCPDHAPDVPLYTYRLTKFLDLPSLFGEDKDFIDVIGMITEIGDAESVMFRYQPEPTRRRIITLRDFKHAETKIYLWGQKADEFYANGICAGSENRVVVAIFVGMLVKKYSGEIYLSGNSACKWYVNPDVPEVKLFVSSLKKDPKPIIRVAATPAPIPVQRPHVEPEKRSLAQIKETNPYDFPPEGFCCTVTLARYDANQSWWFPSCNRCSKTSIRDGSGYKCPRDQCMGYKYKYKPCYFATDGSTEVELVFFDEAGRRLIGKDVKQLIRTASNFGSIPSDIAAQIGQRYDLTVNVTNKAFLSCDYSYEVKWINHAYGREPRVPAIQTQTSNEIATAARNVFEAGMSSTGDHVQNQKSQELPLGELDSPLNQPLQITDDVTPPPSVSPVNTPVPLTEQSSSKKEPARETSARRRLFKERDATESGKTEHAVLEFEDDLDTAVDRSGRVTPPNQAHDELLEKAPPLKKAKKA